MKKVSIMLSGLLVLSIISVGCGSKTTNNVASDIPKGTENTQKQVETNQDKTRADNKNKQSNEVKMDNDFKIKLNTFFSNFTEADLGYFKDSNISDEQLFRFGAKHLAINHIGELVNTGVQIPPYKVTKEQISSSIKKYFNKQIKIDKFIPFNQDGIEYKDGYFLASPGEGEYKDFAIIKVLYDNGNDYFTAHFNVYNEYYLTDENLNYPEPYKNIDLDKKSAKVLYKVKAKIHKESDGRYILIDYLEDK